MTGCLRLFRVTEINKDRENNINPPGLKTNIDGETVGIERSRAVSTSGSLSSSKRWWDRKPRRGKVLPNSLPQGPFLLPISDSEYQVSLSPLCALHIRLLTFGKVKCYSKIKSPFDLSP